MDLRFTPEEAAFREEVRRFLRANLPAGIRERMRLGYPPRRRAESRSRPLPALRDPLRRRILNRKGWAAIPGRRNGAGRAGGREERRAAWRLRRQADRRRAHRRRGAFRNHLLGGRDHALPVIERVILADRVA